MARSQRPRASTWRRLAASTRKRELSAGGIIPDLRLVGEDLVGLYLFEAVDQVVQSCHRPCVPLDDADQALVLRFGDHLHGFVALATMDGQELHRGEEEVAVGAGVGVL